MTCGEGRAGQTYNSKFEGSRVESRSEKSRPVRRVLYESVRNSSTKIETAVKYCECGISQMHNTHGVLYAGVLAVGSSNMISGTVELGELCYKGSAIKLESRKLSWRSNRKDAPR